MRLGAYHSDVAWYVWDVSLKFIRWIFILFSQHHHGVDCSPYIASMLFRTREARRWRWCLINFAFLYKLILGRLRLKCEPYFAIAMSLTGQSSWPAVWYSIVPTLGLDDNSS